MIRRRKRRSPEEKLQIVRETLQSPESVAVIARRHGVNANQVLPGEDSISVTISGLAPKSR